MKTGFLITARMKSTRLPLKLTTKLNGREVIRHMLDRLKLSDALSNIIICTSPNPQDKVLQDIANEEGVDCFLGNEEDVLLRLYEAAKKFQLDYVLNITADCPLVAYEYFPQIIGEYKNTKADLIRSFGLPHGLFSYGMDIGALRKICDIKDSVKTEIWGGYFTDTNLFKVLDLEIPERHRRDYRLTLDYPEDLEFFKRLYGYFGKDTYKKTVDEILRYLDSNPHVVQINRHCEKKYKKRYKTQERIRLKASPQTKMSGV